MMVLLCLCTVNLLAGLDLTIWEWIVNLKHAPNHPEISIHVKSMYSIFSSSFVSTIKLVYMMQMQEQALNYSDLTFDNDHEYGNVGIDFPTNEKVQYSDLQPESIMQSMVSPVLICNVMHVTVCDNLSLIHI